MRNDFPPYWLTQTLANALNGLGGQGIDVMLTLTIPAVQADRLGLTEDCDLTIAGRTVEVRRGL